MHGQVGTAFFQRRFQLFHKQAFATHFAQGAVQDLVATRRHAQQRDRMAQPFQQGFDVFGLPQGQAAFTGGDGEVQGVEGHDWRHGIKRAEARTTRGSALNATGEQGC